MTLRHSVATLSLLLTVFGCAGVTEYMPHGGSAADSARVVILRDRQLFGHDLFLRVGVMLDGWPIARLRIGQYVQFWVPPGRHTIREEPEIWEPPGPHSVSTTWRFSVTLAFQKGESYYFVISENWVEMSGMEIEQWPADRAQQLMAKYRRLEVE